METGCTGGDLHGDCGRRDVRGPRPRQGHGAWREPHQVQNRRLQGLRHAAREAHHRDGPVSTAASALFGRTVSAGCSVRLSRLPRLVGIAVKKARETIRQDVGPSAPPKEQQARANSTKPGEGSCLIWICRGPLLAPCFYEHLDE